MSIRLLYVLFFIFWCTYSVGAQPVLHLVVQDQIAQPVFDVYASWQVVGKDKKSTAYTDTTVHLIREAEAFFTIGAQKGQKIFLQVRKEGFKAFNTSLTLTKDTTQVRVLLKRETILLPEVGITVGRLMNEQTKDHFNALDYYLDDSVVLILGKVGNKLQLRLYNSNLKLHSIGSVPYSDLKMLTDCNQTVILHNDTAVFEVVLNGKKATLARTFTIADVEEYVCSPCILKREDTYFYRYNNRNKSSFVFYYSKPNSKESHLYFVSTNDKLSSEINSYIPNLASNYGRYLPFDPANPLVPIELSNALGNTVSTAAVRGNKDGFTFFKKVLLNPGQCSLFYHSNQFHILDMERYHYHSIDTGYTRCTTGSFAHLAGGGKWSKKFFADEHYSRLFTTYVQGDTRVVEVKGEKLDQTETVATIPFNGYFPEKLKIRGSYLYYLMFDGKKRVLYRHRLEGT